MKDLRDLQDLTIHDVKRINYRTEALTWKMKIHVMTVVAKQPASAPHTLRIVPHTVPRVDRSYLEDADAGDDLKK